MATKLALADINPIEPVDITAVIANRLRDLLGQGKFAPGEQLTEASIATAFQVSRGPVREALKRLTEQGLLVSERNRGVFVPVLSDEDVRDIYRLRGAVESAALAELVRNPRPETFSHLWSILGRYRKSLRARDWENADELLMDFTAKLAHLRRAHPALNADAFLTGDTVRGGDMPDVQWLREDGNELLPEEWNDGSRRFLGMSVYAPREEADEFDSERAVIYINGSHDDANVRLPEPRPGSHFQLYIQSDWPDLEPRTVDHTEEIVVKGRSVFIMLEEKGEPA